MQLKCYFNAFLSHEATIGIWPYSEGVYVFLFYFHTLNNFSCINIHYNIQENIIFNAFLSHEAIIGIWLYSKVVL